MPRSCRSATDGDGKPTLATTAATPMSAVVPAALAHITRRSDPSWVRGRLLSIAAGMRCEGDSEAPRPGVSESPRRSPRALPARVAATVEPATSGAGTGTATSGAGTDAMASRSIRRTRAGRDAAGIGRSMGRVNCRIARSAARAATGRSGSLLSAGRLAGTSPGPVVPRGSRAVARRSRSWSSVTSGFSSVIGGAPTTEMGPLGCGGRRSGASGAGALGRGSSAARCRPRGLSTIAFARFVP